MAYLRLGFTLTTSLLALLLVFPVQWAVSKTRILSPGLFASGYCRFVCRLLGIRVLKPSVDPWPSAGLIVPNHVSWIDILVLAAMGQTRFLAKKEIGSWPIVGFLARLQGVIFVDRQRKRSIPAVNHAMAEVLSAGKSVILFAEGTTNDGTHTRKFHSPHFQAAIQSLQARSEETEEDTKIVIMPIALVYSHRHGLPMGRGERAQVAWYGDMALMPHMLDLLRLGPVDCRVVSGAPIKADVKSCRKNLAFATEVNVRRLLAGARR